MQLSARHVVPQGLSRPLFANVAVASDGIFPDGTRRSNTPGPSRWLFPSIIIFCAVGNCSINNSAMDLYLVGIMGILGYVLMKLECPPAPLILGFVLGPLMDENLRRALLISRGDPTMFFTRPIACGFMIASVLIPMTMIMPAIRKKKVEAHVAGGGDAP